MESATARICREAGGRVQQNVFVRDRNIGTLAPTDGRRIEVIVDGLPLHHGCQLAIDATLVGALRRDGRARPHAAEEDRAALKAARRRKTATYPELSGRGSRARLVVFAMEVGARWSREAWIFVRLLARARARSEPRLLRRAAEAAWRRRWVVMLSCAAARAFAASLLETPHFGGSDGQAPSTMDVVMDCRHLGPDCR